MTNRRSARFSMAWTNSSSLVLSAVFNLKSFTKSWLTSSFWIGYVYLACLLILFFVSVTIRALVDFVGWSNAFGLRNAIARELSCKLVSATLNQRFRSQHFFSRL